MFRELIRKKQQLSQEEAISVLKQEPRGILSLQGDDGYPYGIPMDHFYNDADGCIYFQKEKKGHGYPNHQPHAQKCYDRRNSSV